MPTRAQLWQLEIALEHTVQESDASRKKPGLQTWEEPSSQRRFDWLNRPALQAVQERSDEQVRQVEEEPHTAESVDTVGSWYRKQVY